MPSNPTALPQKDLQSLFHPITNLATHAQKGPLIIDHAKGVVVTDTSGKDYIEGMAGLWCTALGYGVEELVEAAATQMSKLSYGHLFGGRAHEPAIELASRLADLVPIKGAKVFFGNSGSDANDTQVKLAWYHNNCIGRPQKKKIISRMSAYHGVTIASASLTGLAVNQNDFDLPLDRFLHTSLPHHYRAAAEGETQSEFADRLAKDLETLIISEGPETIAAFIAEPVMGAGGVIVPPDTYFPKIRTLLDNYDISLIDDEVICGFYRTGKRFGAETFDMRPDSMTLAKALSSAYLPISAVIVPGTMYDEMIEGSRRNGAFGHGYTYSGHPVCAAVTLKTLDLMEEWNIARQVSDLAPVFQKRLNALHQHSLVGEARGVGMIGGLELVADKDTKERFEKPGQVGLKCIEFALEEGLIVRNLGDTIALCPPLVITETETNEMFDRVTRALDRTQTWVDSNL